MKVELLDRTMVDSDLGVVNAARCSFDKESKWEYQHTKQCEIDSSSCEDWHNTPVLSQKDVRLINYLANNKHWTPFAHAQETFLLNITRDELLIFFLDANLSGFEWTNVSNPFLIRGSLYAWLTNLNYLPFDITRDIGYTLEKKYPISHNALNSCWDTDCYSPQGKCRVTHVKDSSIVAKEINPFTFRIHCPIFVKRQLETHRRNFVMTDIEDFSQNEVSRRYVDTIPEIYFPKSWRIQHKEKKQGSSEEVLTGAEAVLTNSNYDHHTHNSLLYYEKFNEFGIAHELSRMILPLSTYTTFWWTGSLNSWDRMFQLRLDSHAQSETREIAQMCYEEIQKHV